MNTRFHTIQGIMKRTEFKKWFNVQEESNENVINSPSNLIDKNHVKSIFYLSTIVNNL